MASRNSIFKELWDFIRANKTYYLVPIILILLVFVGLIVFSLVTGGAAAPFIYTLF